MPKQSLFAHHPTLILPPLHAEVFSDVFLDPCYLLAGRKQVRIL